MENKTAFEIFTYELPVAIYNSLYIYDVYLMVALSVVFLLGTLGNGLVIWFVAFKMKKTVNTIWILNLAIADFTFSLFQPLEVIRLALDEHWPFGGVMCKLNSFFVHLNMFSSILQLTVISIDRCISIVSPFWCRNPKRMRLAWKVVVGIWILAIVCSLPFFLYVEIFRDDDGWIYCFDGANEFLYKERVILRFIIFFLIPFIIIASCSTIIIYLICRNPRITSTKAYKMIASVIITFFICWLPYHVFFFMLVSARETKNSQAIYESLIGLQIATSVAYANSCLNPFLYVFFGRDFKEKICSSIQVALNRAFTEDNNCTDPEGNIAQGQLSEHHDHAIAMSP